MGSQVGQEYVSDQGLFYPLDANYYGYYCTGFETPGECDGHQIFFGVDGQDPNFSGLQSENLPNVYYTPSYAYTQSSYNPYNPYIPGAVVGTESPYAGSQQLFVSSSYQQAVTPPSYFVVQSGSEVLPDHSSVSAVFPNGDFSSSMNYIPSLGSAKTTSQGISSRNSMSGPAHSSPNQGKDPGLVALNSLPPARGASKHGVVSQDTQVKSSSNTSRANDQLSYGKDSLVQQSMKITASATNGFTTLGSNVRGWDTVDRYRPRFFNAIMNNANQNADLLGEQNRGVRTNRSKGSDIVVRAYTTKAGSADAEGNITIHRDHYNREDFPIDHPDAKFFVIKSYSEDDVHKSIKYNVWSSTPNGNKRLQSAYEEAQRISIARSRKCPVFLFFSVNASGQFCGVAEMLGPVDFSKDMDFWQQDKWTGSFPVKWLIVKDIPNTSFRHIILENNESKPVTNSRDTQEIAYLPGINMLCIFKSCPLKTSILDDFMFYEERQRAAYEERSRLLGRSNDVAISALTGPSSSPVFPGTYDSLDRHTLNRVIKHPLESERELLNGETTQLPKVERKLHDALGGVKPRAKVDGPLRADVVHINAKEEPHLKAEGKTETPKVDEHTMEYDKELPAVKRLPNVDVKQRNGVISQPFKGDQKHSVRKASGRQSIQKIDTSALPKSESDPNNEQIDDSVGLSSIMKVGSMSIDSNIGKSNRKTPDVAGGASVDVITVGSVHIKVEKPTDAGVLTVGPIQLIQKE